MRIRSASSGRRGRPGSPFALLMLLSLLAGCVGGSDAEEDTGGADSGQCGSDVPAGSVKGRVITELFEPIAGALIFIQGTNVNVTNVTDETGLFVADCLQPKIYNVIVTSEDHRSAFKSVRVQEGATTWANFTLRSIPKLLPYSEQFSFEGFIDCEYGGWGQELRRQDCGFTQGQTSVTPLKDPNNKQDFDFTTGPYVAEIVLDAKWVPSVPDYPDPVDFNDVSDMQFVTHELLLDENGAPIPDPFVGHKRRYSYDDACCANPLRWNISSKALDQALDIEQPFQDDRVFRTTGYVRSTGRVDSPTLAMGQRFEVWATVFYVEPGPEGFSNLDPAPG